LPTFTRTFKLCVGRSNIFVILIQIVNLDKQLSKPDATIQQLILLASAVLLTLLLGVFGIHRIHVSDPYIKSVLSLPGNSTQGKAIFQMNCAGCHGWQGDGSVGPSLQGVSKHKSRYGLIHQVVSGETPPMPQFQPNSKEMADLLSYLETL
jgi:mono/diheme cytochrome c family protein